MWTAINKKQKYSSLLDHQLAKNGLSVKAGVGNQGTEWRESGWGSGESGENARNLGGNAGNQGGNVGNMGGNAVNRGVNGGNRME